MTYHDLTPVQARLLAEALVAAADSVERATDVPDPHVYAGVPGSGLRIRVGATE